MIEQATEVLSQNIQEHRHFLNNCITKIIPNLSSWPTIAILLPACTNLSSDVCLSTRNRWVAPDNTWTRVFKLYQQKRWWSADRHMLLSRLIISSTCILPRKSTLGYRILTLNILVKLSLICLQAWKWVYFPVLLKFTHFVILYFATTTFWLLRIC